MLRTLRNAKRCVGMETDMYLSKNKTEYLESEVNKAETKMQTHNNKQFIYFETSCDQICRDGVQNILIVPSNNKYLVRLIKARLHEVYTVQVSICNLSPLQKSIEKNTNQ